MLLIRVAANFTLNKHGDEQWKLKYGCFAFASTNAN